MHPKEFLHQKWNKPDKEIQAPNICKVIKKFNQTSFWVVSCIVSKTNLKVRSVLLKRFIEIASVILHSIIIYILFITFF